MRFRIPLTAALCCSALLSIPACGRDPSVSELTGDQDSAADAPETCKESKADLPSPATPGACHEPTIVKISPESGAPGAEVHIYGSGFGDRQGLSKVTFNAIEAVPEFEGLEARPGGDVLSWSDREVVVKVPDRAANEPELPAAVVISCGEVRWRSLGKVKVPFVLYFDSNVASYDIRRPGSDLDVGFWVFRMGTFGNEHALTDDPISPCDARIGRCVTQQARACDRNDLDFGKYGVSSSQCAGMGIRWGGQSYTAPKAVGLDADGDGKADVRGGVLENANGLGLYPEMNRDLETGNFPETLLLNGEDVELSDSSGYVGLRRVRDKKGQVRYGITCAFCHTGDSLGTLPASVMAGTRVGGSTAAKAVAAQLPAGAGSDTGGSGTGAISAPAVGTGGGGPASLDGGGLAGAGTGGLAGVGSGGLAGARTGGPVVAGNGGEAGPRYGAGAGNPGATGEGVSAASGGPMHVMAAPGAAGGATTAGGPVHVQAGADVLGPDPGNPMPHHEVAGEADGIWSTIVSWLGGEPPPPPTPLPSDPAYTRSAILAAQGATLRPEQTATGPMGLSERPPGIEQVNAANAASPMGPDPNNPAAPGAPMAARRPDPDAAIASMGADPNNPAAPGAPPRGPGPGRGGATAEVLGVDPSNPAPPGAPHVDRGASPGEGGPPPRGGQPGAPRVAGGPNVRIDVIKPEVPHPPDQPLPPDPLGGLAVGRQPEPVENGLTNRTLKLGTILANSRLVEILDEVDPLPGGATRRRLLIAGGAGRLDFHGFPRVPADTGFEAVAIPHHLGTTGFTRMLYSDHVDRSPLAEVQRRITQQALFDTRNVGALLNARGFFGLITRSQFQIDAVRALAIYLNATQHGFRARPLLEAQARHEPDYNATRIARGRALFSCHGCVNCHSPHLGRYTSQVMIPLSTIGTDPRHALARGNLHEGEGEYVPLPVQEGTLRAELRPGLTWVLELNRIVSPRVDRDLRDRFQPVVVRMESPTLDRLQASAFVGEGIDGGLKVQPMAGRPATMLTGTRDGARLSFTASRLTLQTDGGGITLQDVVVNGVLHPDASTWGAPLGDNRLARVTGVVETSALQEIAPGSRFEAYLSGVREDLFAGLRLPASLETLGYRVQKLIGMRYKVGFLHDGSLKSLEEMMDPKRFTSGYQPTAFDKPPPGYNAVPGHQFTLIDDAEERAALLAFLKTL